MSVLNESLQLNQLPEDIQRAFQRPALKKRFEKDHVFYKLTSYDVNPTSITPWWASYEPAIASDSGFNGAWNHPLGIRNHMRISAAVALKWNKMENLMMMRLREPVWGFVGPTAHQFASASQKWSETPNKEKFGSVLLGGGLVQVFLPNMTLQHVELLMKVNVS